MKSLRSLKVNSFCLASFLVDVGFCSNFNTASLFVKNGSVLVNGRVNKNPLYLLKKFDTIFGYHLNNGSNNMEKFSPHYFLDRQFKICIFF
jgi:hypothetical protein